MGVKNWMAAARDEEFAARVAFCLMKTAIDIANEDPATEHHADRLHFAQLHFRAAINTKAIAAAVIANNTTIQTEIDASPNQRGGNVPDNDLQFVINGLVNNFAQAYAAV